MTCKIVTGKKKIALGSNSGKEEKDRYVLFDGNSLSTVSHVIHVEPCKAYKVSAFGLPDGVKLNFHRVHIGGGEMAQGYGCNCECDPAVLAKTLLSEPFKIACNPVYLDNCNGMLFLTAPGYYRIELSDQTALGKVVAFAEEVDCCCLPDALVIGSVVSGSVIGTGSKLGA